jgi:hypothetical protein
MFDNLAKRGLSLSIIVGTLLVPLTAVAAIWLTDPARGEQTASPATKAIPASTVTAQSTSAAIDMTAALQTACGPEGMQLISLEESGTITDVQQAALDALRGVCEQQGMPLPPKAELDPVVQTIVVPAMAVASPYEDEHESEDEHEYEDEHESEVEHEDDD